MKHESINTVKVEEKELLTTLYQTVIWILETYFTETGWKRYFFKYVHKHSSFIFYLKKRIIALMMNFSEQEDYIQKKHELLKLLDQHRYYLATHTQSWRARFVVQDTLLAVLVFNFHYYETFKKFPKNEYLLSILKNDELETFVSYYQQRRAFFGRPRESLNDMDILLAARATYINGKLLEVLGIDCMLMMNLERLGKKILELKQHQVEKGFLTQERMEGILEKIKLLLKLIKQHDPEFPLDDVVRQARNLIETILNAICLNFEGQPQYSEHIVLMSCCYWIDEIFQSIRAKTE